MKHHPQERYSIFVVPRNSSTIRRVVLSRRLLVSIGVGCASMVLLGVGLFLGLLFYRNAYHATEGLRIEAANFQRERGALLASLMTLGSAVGRTDRFAARLEASHNKKAEAPSGQGPVDEEDWLPTVEERQGSGSFELQRSTWKSPFSGALSADLHLKLDELSGEIAGVEERLHRAFGHEQDQLFLWVSLPTVWPTRGWITSEFGDRRGGHGHSRWHEGIDIAGPSGTPIIASADGFVTYAGYRQGYGKALIIDHGYGVTTLYGHCSKVFVDEGMRVKRGMTIGTIGSTGRSTGPHLHYEVHVDGIAVDPMLYIIEKS